MAVTKEEIENIFNQGYDDLTLIESLTNLGIKEQTIKEIIYNNQLNYNNEIIINLLMKEIKEGV